MLTSITPLGERGRGHRYAVTMTAYVLGCLLGGATTGVLLGRAASHGELRAVAAGLERRAPLAARTTVAALALGGGVLLTAALA